MTARERQVSSAEGRALTHGDAHQQGTHDAVREAERRRHLPVRHTLIRADMTAAQELTAALVFARHERSPGGRLARLRSVASMLSCTAGECMRDEADEPALRAAEDDVIAAIHARRSA